MAIDPNLRFEVITNGKGQFLLLPHAGIAYNNPWARVTLGRTMLPDGSTRAMTKEEQQAISKAADDYSASK